MSPHEIFVMLREGDEGANKTLSSCVLVFFRLRGQDYQLCMQVSMKGWKIIVIFVSFFSDFFFVFVGKNFQAEPRRNTERRTCMI